MIDYLVVRSARRKTISLQVKQGKVLVRAPHFVDKKFLNNLVQEKATWLKAKIVEQSQVNQHYCQFSHGDKLCFLGQQVRLSISFARSKNTVLTEPFDGEPQLSIILAERAKDKLSNDKQRLQVSVKKHLEHYFKQQAQAVILPKVSFFSELTKLKPSDIKIRQYSARWGSCNSKGELSFNYLMMMLPEHVIDYIVVHELCHLRFLNHSPDFWRLVKQYFPHYLQAKQWLKDNQSQLLWRLA